MIYAFSRDPFKCKIKVTYLNGTSCIDDCTGDNRGISDYVERIANGSGIDCVEVIDETGKVLQGTYNRTKTVYNIVYDTGRKTAWQRIENIDPKDVENQLKFCQENGFRIRHCSKTEIPVTPAESNHAISIF